MFHTRQFQCLVFLLLVLWFPGLHAGTGSPISPDQWNFHSQRPEIAPIATIDTVTRYMGGPTLALAGNGKAYAIGCWTANVHVNPHTWVRFTTHYLPVNVDEPHRSLLARIIWLDANGKQVGTTEYPAVKQEDGPVDWRIMEQSYPVPGGTDSARIELVYRWDADGSVNFGGTTLEPATKPAPRLVRLASVHRWPHDRVHTMAETRQDFADLVAMAAEQQADIVCLPEGINTSGLGTDYVTGSEPIPGPTTDFLAGLARQYKLYIVAGVMERDGEVVYNSAVLLDRQGKLAGKYRKVSLPREEIEGGVTPGDSYPVFDTDFGRIAMLICWDISFPEAARSVALQGAEVVLMPIAGGNVTMAGSRAIENQVYLVTSGYDMITAVFDPRGEIVCQASDDDPVIVREVDLNEHVYWPWLGDFKNRITREMPAQRALVTQPE